MHNPDSMVTTKATKTSARAKSPKRSRITPVHQWTHDGDRVLILKCVNPDGTSYNGFQWPSEGRVESASWSREPTCESGGLFGWPWGIGLGDGKEPDYRGVWIVWDADPKDVIRTSAKVKAPCGNVVFYGTWWQAFEKVRAGQLAWIRHAARGAASATGGRGAASATGWRGAASATGWRGAASATGERGAASATGERGAASATGACALAGVTGSDGRARGGAYGCLALAWMNRAEHRAEMRCARIGCGDGSDGTLKAETWYRLNDFGEFMEDPNQS